MNIPKTKYEIMSILKDASDVPEVLRLEGPCTLKANRINKYYSTEIYNIISWITIEFERIQIGIIIFQIIVLIIHKGIHGVNIYPSTGCCHQHQCQYPLKKII